MLHRVELKQQAEEELDALPALLRHRIIDKLLALEENPRPKRLRKLTNRDVFRLRIASHRILFEVHSATLRVMVFAIEPRREVYGAP